MVKVLKEGSNSKSPSVQAQRSSKHVKGGSSTKSVSVPDKK